MTATLHEALLWRREDRPLKDAAYDFVCLEKAPFCPHTSESLLRSELNMNIQAILRHSSPNTTERYLKRLGLGPNKLKGALQLFENRHPEKEKAPEGAASRASALSTRIVHPERTMVH